MTELFDLPVGAERNGKSARSERDVEGGQRPREALAAGLEQSLLASPVSKERRVPLARGKEPQLRRFAHREVTACDVIRLGQRALLLDVDTQLATAREDQDSEPARVGEAEAQPFVLEQVGL